MKKWGYKGRNKKRVGEGRKEVGRGEGEKNRGRRESRVRFQIQWAKSDGAKTIWK